jgi:NADPH2:quinone reductase
MKVAVIYGNGGPEVLRYEQVPDPGWPNSCVVVDAEAIRSEGGDLHARASVLPPAVPTHLRLRKCRAIGEVAAGVEERAVDDRVVALNAADRAARRAVLPPSPG